jgi:hypothetical protein
MNLPRHILRLVLLGAFTFLPAHAALKPLAPRQVLSLDGTWQIEQGGLLQYLVSFRNHNEFHEQCVERIFMDIWTRCKPLKLSVYARYTRRGGLDINPFRTSHPQALPRNIRTARQ